MISAMSARLTFAILCGWSISLTLRTISAASLFASKLSGAHGHNERTYPPARRPSRPFCCRVRNFVFRRRRCESTGQIAGRAAQAGGTERQQGDYGQGGVTKHFPMRMSDSERAEHFDSPYQEAAGREKSARGAGHATRRRSEGQRGQAVEVLLGIADEAGGRHVGGQLLFKLQARRQPAHQGVVEVGDDGQTGDEPGDIILAGDMGQLVGDGRTELFLIPIGPGGGQQHDWSPPADGRRASPIRPIRTP